MSTSPNRAYLATVFLTSAQIPLRGNFRYARNVMLTFNRKLSDLIDDQSSLFVGETTKIPPPLLMPLIEISEEIRRVETLSVFLS